MQHRWYMETMLPTVASMQISHRGLALQVIIALLLGYMVSAVITSNGGQKYITSSDFDTAPSITFLWVKTFGFGFYAPAVLPFLIGTHSGQSAVSLLLSSFCF